MHRLLVWKIKLWSISSTAQNRLFLVILYWKSAIDSFTSLRLNNQTCFSEWGLCSKLSIENTDSSHGILCWKYLSALSLLMVGFEGTLILSCLSCSWSTWFIAFLNYSLLPMSVVSLTTAIPRAKVHRFLGSSTNCSWILLCSSRVKSVTLG